MDDLIAFNTARLDEDEAVALAARKLAPSDTELAQQAGPCVSDATYLHIERYGPARVLREVAAKRARLAAYIAARVAVPPVGDWCEVADGIKVGMADGLEIAVRHDAAVWSDHPDYIEWHDG